MDGQVRSATRRAFGWVMASMFVLISMSPAVVSARRMPGSIEITQGYTAHFSLVRPFRAEVSDDAALAISGMDESIQDVGEGVRITGESVGSASIILKVLGIPVKKVSVNVNPEKRLMPGGQSVGIAIRTDGVLVIGSSDVGSAASPARVAGLKSGDMIEKVNGVKVESAAHMTTLLTNEAAAVEVLRAGKQVLINIQPAVDERDGIYRLGAWVRDSTAGVGTLSFYDMETGTFGALGHAIADVDTGSILAIGDGGLFESAIIGITRGESGLPGELIGEFAHDSSRIGDITDNGDFGIYGETYSPVINELYPNGLPIATRDEVQLGNATILTTLGGGMKEYACEIEKVYGQEAPKQRGLVVKITDEALLEKTGGIVQGMSGSPILQNGRIVGAVTHVFVNDPTRGYGIYIDWMLEQVEDAEQSAA